MDIGVNMVIGAIYRFLYDFIKKALKLTDASAAWGMIILAFVTSVLYNLLAGGFAGISFDVTAPVQALQSIGAGMSVILATATSLFSLTKKTAKK